MYNLKVAIFDEYMAIRESEYLVILYQYELTQPSDPLILGDRLILRLTNWQYTLINYLATLIIVNKLKKNWQ